MENFANIVATSVDELKSGPELILSADNILRKFIWDSEPIVEPLPASREERLRKTFGLLDV